MLGSLATFPLLTGFRGSPEADLEAVQELLLRVSAMVETHHEIAELDLNPVLAGPEGAHRRRLSRQGEERAAAPPLAGDLEVARLHTEARLGLATGGLAARRANILCMHWLRLIRRLLLAGGLACF